MDPAFWLVFLREKLSTDRIATAAVFILGFLVFIPFLGTLGLWDPWEVHYGEVAREMIMRDDYVYPHWEWAHFFSKPALPMWLMALGMLLVGAESGAPGEALGSWTEWGMRLPFALIAMVAVWSVYRIGRDLKDRATGFIVAVVLASSAQFIFIGKQAMVDMPLVGLMTIGLSFFLSVVFDDEEDAPAPRNLKIGAILTVALSIFPQMALIIRETGLFNGPTGTSIYPTSDGWALAGDLGSVTVLVLGSLFCLALGLKGSRHDCYLAVFYCCIGLAALAKGLAVLAMVGPMVLLYMMLSGDWRLLKRCKLWLGAVLFLLVASPWYVTLSFFGGRDDEGKTFVARFWMHDNFSRVGRGVHGDRRHGEPRRPEAGRRRRSARPANAQRA